jgi:hypothetical protein
VQAGNSNADDPDLTEHRASPAPHLEIPVARSALEAPPPVSAPPPLPPEVSPQQVLDWIDDLRDDDIRWNAIRARQKLTEAGPGTIPFLRPALLSNDGQQRMLVGRLLRSFDDTTTDALVVVSLEAMRSDRPSPGDHGNDAAHAFHWLRTRVEAARPRIEAALASDDPQQAFLCACLLARTGRTQSFHRTVSLLIDRLQDNSITGDAVLSAHALYRLGTPVLPHLREAWLRADPQAQQLLSLIELDLQEPPRTRADIEARGERHDVTTIYHDPVVEYDVERSHLPAR